MEDIKLKTKVTTRDNLEKLFKLMEEYLSHFEHFDIKFDKIIYGWDKKTLLKKLISEVTNDFYKQFVIAEIKDYPLKGQTYVFLIVNKNINFPYYSIMGFINKKDDQEKYIKLMCFDVKNENITVIQNMLCMANGDENLAEPTFPSKYYNINNSQEGYLVDRYIKKTYIQSRYYKKFIKYRTKYLEMGKKLKNKAL